MNKIEITKNLETKIIQSLKNRGSNWVSEAFIVSFDSSIELLSRALKNLKNSGKIEEKIVFLHNYNGGRPIKAKMYRLKF